MEAERILNELTHYERLPVEAMRAAAADREVVLPHFIQALPNTPKGRIGATKLRISFSSPFTYSESGVRRRPTGR
jgi:hypothetical protein